jgi:hypothetical protein
MNIVAGIATDEIKRRLSPREVLQDLGARLRPRHRSDCPLPRCKGSQRGTVSYNDTLWYCFRCTAGGDVITRYERAYDCNFSSALKYAAGLARVPLPTRMSPITVADEWHFKRQWLERDRQRNRTQSICDQLEAEEREMRRRCVDWIRYCDTVLNAPGPWSETRWQLAKAARALRDEFLLPEYCLLSYAAVSERNSYLASDECQRASMIAKVRQRGGVTAQNGRFVPISQE